MTTYYEWDVETLDEDGDIVDHRFSDAVAKLVGELEAPNTALVLVRNVGDDEEGITDRQWARVVDGKLPEFFNDSYADTDARVPKRFHSELERAMKRRD